MQQQRRQGSFLTGEVAKMREDNETSVLSRVKMFESTAERNRNEAKGSPFKRRTGSPSKWNSPEKFRAPVPSPTRKSFPTSPSWTKSPMSYKEESAEEEVEDVGDDMVLQEELPSPKAPILVEKTASPLKERPTSPPKPSPRNPSPTTVRSETELSKPLSQAKPTRPTPSLRPFPYTFHKFDRSSAAPRQHAFQSSKKYPSLAYTLSSDRDDKPTERSPAVTERDDDASSTKSVDSAEAETPTKPKSVERINLVSYKPGMTGSNLIAQSTKPKPVERINLVSYKPGIMTGSNLIAQKFQTRMAAKLQGNVTKGNALNEILKSKEKPASVKDDNDSCSSDSECSPKASARKISTGPSSDKSDLYTVRYRNSPLHKMISQKRKTKLNAEGNEPLKVQNVSLANYGSAQRLTSQLARTPSLSVPEPTLAESQSLDSIKSPSNTEEPEHPVFKYKSPFTELNHQDSIDEQDENDYPDDGILSVDSSASCHSPQKVGKPVVFDDNPTRNQVSSHEEESEPSHVRRSKHLSSVMRGRVVPVSTKIVGKISPKKKSPTRKHRKIQPVRKTKPSSRQARTSTTKTSLAAQVNARLKEKSSQDYSTGRSPTTRQQRPLKKKGELGRQPHQTKRIDPSRRNDQSERIELPRKNERTQRLARSNPENKARVDQANMAIRDVQSERSKDSEQRGSDYLGPASSIGMTSQGTLPRKGPSKQLNTVHRQPRSTEDTMKNARMLLSGGEDREDPTVEVLSHGDDYSEASSGLGLTALVVASENNVSGTVEHRVWEAIEKHEENLRQILTAAERIDERRTQQRQADRHHGSERRSKFVEERVQEKSTRRSQSVNPERSRSLKREPIQRTQSEESSPSVERDPYVWMQEKYRDAKEIQVSKTEPSKKASESEGQPKKEQMGDEEDVFSGLDEESLIQNAKKAEVPIVMLPSPGKRMSRGRKSRRSESPQKKTKNPVIVEPPRKPAARDAHKEDEVSGFAKHSGKTIDNAGIVKSVLSDLTSSLITGPDRGRSLWRSQLKALGDDTIVEEDDTVEKMESGDDGTQIEGQCKPPESSSVIMNIGAAFVTTLKNVCKVPEVNIPSSTCNEIKCETKVPTTCAPDDNSELLDEELLDDNVRDEISEAETGTVTANMLNDMERRIWEAWENRRQNKPDPNAVANMTTPQAPIYESSTTSTMNDNQNMVQHQEFRKEAQNALLAHAEKALELFGQAAEASSGSVSGSSFSDNPQDSFESERSSNVSVEEQVNLERFSFSLKNSGIEVLKLGRRNKWQIRFLTVSREVTRIGTGGAAGDIGQCPKALLWPKQFKAGSFSMNQIKENGRGGVLFEHLHNVRPTASNDFYDHHLPKKMKSLFPKFAGVVIDYHHEGGDRQLHLCFKSVQDAQAFITTMLIIKEATDRRTSILETA